MQHGAFFGQIEGVLGLENMGFSIFQGPKNLIYHHSPLEMAISGGISRLHCFLPWVLQHAMASCLYLHINIRGISGSAVPGCLFQSAAGTSLLLDFPQQKPH
jgi:hypothetical protein